MSSQPRVKLPLSTKFSMISHYIRRKVTQQIRSVAFIVVYLLLFQLVVLRSPDAVSGSVLLGLVSVVLGLTLFLEGLFLGLMPLGERVGLKLPGQVRFYKIIVFSLLLGFVATLAEPAIATLRSAGSNILPWEQPLLYALLNTYTESLVAAVGAGVALAVGLSIYRFYYGISIKPFIFSILPLVLLGTLLFSYDENLNSVIGLAWDTGAVTTGPVTVPLVLALGIGVSRASVDRKGESGGYGSIALASLLPVLGVMILSVFINFTIPQPMSEETFLSTDSEPKALSILGDEQLLKEYRGMYESTGDSAGSSLYSQVEVEETTTQILTDQTVSALQAIIPLTLILLAVLFIMLRSRPQFVDEFLFGIVITIAGMILLTFGIRVALVPLGNTVGQQLPKVYAAEEYEQAITIPDFDLSLVQQAIDRSGENYSFFMLVSPSGDISQQRFDRSQYDPDTRTYTHIHRRPVLFERQLTTVSMIFVLIFAFGLGYGSTLAEPALHALGRNIEETTARTVSKTGVIRAVSLGVGAGLTVGVLRIIYAIPLAWLLLPMYILVIPLTIFSSRDFASIAWDSGGVTTGPITVPLVLSLGLGIGGAVGLADGFGILALASVFPIFTLLCYGFIIAGRQKRTLRELEQETSYE